MSTIRTPSSSLAALTFLALVMAILFSIATSRSNGQGSSSMPGLPASGAGTGEGQFNSALLNAAIDGAGNLYIADSSTHIIRKIAPNGAATILAGSENVPGSSDGTGVAAKFSAPQGVAVDASGNVFVADAGNHTIRKITFAGNVTTLAGSAGMAGNTDGTGTDAKFSSPQGVAVDLRGNLYVADTKNNAIRRITPLGFVTTLAGAGFPGYADGAANQARFLSPTRIAIDPEGTLYVADTGNHLIRKISPSGAVSTVAGAFVRQPRIGISGGYADGTGSEARFNSPTGIVVEANGDLYIADSGNEKIRKISRGGVVTTVDGISRDRSDADNRFRLRGRFARGTRTIPAQAFERPSGNYIAGGLPSPGDIDVRFNKQPDLNLPAGVGVQREFVVGTIQGGHNNQSRDRSRGNRH